MVVQGRTGKGRPNANGDVLPDLDPEMLMSASGRSELAGARAHTSSFLQGSPPESEPFFSPRLDEDFLSPPIAGFDISFEQLEEAWPEGLPRPTTPSRDRFRVDRGLPAREPFNGRMAAGPSDGRVVGRVGQRGLPVPVREIGREEPVEWIRPPQQESRVVASTRPAGTKPLVTRPVDRSQIPTALERLSRTDFEDDPFT